MCVCVHGAQRIGKRAEHQFPAYSPWLELPEQVGRSLVLRKPCTEVLAEEKKHIKLLRLKRASNYWNKSHLYQLESLKNPKSFYVWM